MDKDEQIRLLQARVAELENTVRHQAHMHSQTKGHVRGLIERRLTGLAVDVQDAVKIGRKRSTCEDALRVFDAVERRALTITREFIDLDKEMAK